MSRTTIRLACSPGELRAAAVRDGVLLDYAIHRPGAPDGIGDRLRGRVSAVVPAMAGAFVALPDGEGFLPDSQGAAGRAVGDAITVVVVRAAQGGKGPRLTAQTPQAGPGAPVLLEPGPGPAQRLLALHPGADVFVDDAFHAPPGAIVVARAWDEDLADQVAALALPGVALPGGARASIHPTPALVAIDVDLGGASAERRVKAAAQRDTNRAALPALARAIRLRNLSGAIVVDLGGMAVRARAALAPDFHAALATDPLRPRFLGFTALGLAEIQRSRQHPPLHEMLAGAHAAALLGLRHMAALSHDDPAAILRLRAAPDVVAAAERDGPARADLARRTGRPLMMRSDPAFPPGHWMVEPVSGA